MQRLDQHLYVTFPYWYSVCLCAAHTDVAPYMGAFNNWITILGLISPSGVSTYQRVIIKAK